MKRALCIFALCCLAFLWANPADAAPPKERCDCCKEGKAKKECTCEEGKLNKDCKCYPCLCVERSSKVGVTFDDIAFTTENGEEVVVFVRTKEGKKFDADVFAGKTLFLNGNPVTTEKLHEWSKTAYPASFSAYDEAVFFFGDQKVARIEPAAPAAPALLNFAPFAPVYPAATPTCPNGNCPAPRRAFP